MVSSSPQRKIKVKPMVFIDDHLSKSYGHQLNTLSHSIRSEWKWPSSSAGFALYLSSITGCPLTSGCEINPLGSDYLSRMDEAPLLAAIGYSMAVGIQNEAPVEEAWAEGMERLKFRNPFTIDRESFVFRPFDLLGLCLGVSAHRDSTLIAWLNKVLVRAEEELKSEGIFRKLLGTWAAEINEADWQKVHLPTFADLDLCEMALVYWTVKLRQNLLTAEAPPLTVINSNILKRFALRHVHEYDVGRSFLLYASLHNCIETVIDTDVSVATSTKLVQRKVTIPEPLSAALYNRTASIIVGAGVSRASADLQGWSDTLIAAREFLVERGISSQALTTIEPLMAEGFYEEAAQVLDRFLKDLNGKADFLYRQFHLSNSLIKERNLVEAIWRLAGNVIFTTNYDRLLELCGPSGVETITWREPGKMLAAIRGESAVVHLHGVYNDPDSVILSVSDYTRLSESESYQSFSKTLWTRGPLLFIGVSPSGAGDLDFSRLFKWAQQTVKNIPFTSYMLQRKNSVDLEEKKMLYADYKVEVVEYGDSFSELCPFLLSISQN